MKATKHLCSINSGKVTVLKTVVAIAIASGLSACGGGGESGNSPQIEANTTSITVFDGLLANAIVCIDSNNNMQCDSSEYSLRSNEQGVANIPDEFYDETSPILVTTIADETRDLDRGIVTQGYQLSAPAGYKIVNPYTHFIQQLISEGKEQTEAELEIASLLTSLNLDSSEQEIQTLITSNYLLNSDLLSQQVLLIGELLTDRYATSNDNTDTLHQFTEQLSSYISEFDASELIGLSPIVEFEEGQFSFFYNHAPAVVGSIDDQQLEYLGDEITSIDLNSYFSDSDGDLLSFSFSPAIAGLSISNGYLTGAPQSAGDYTISVYAADDYTRSDILTFNLKVTNDVPPAPATKTLTSLKIIGSIPEYDGVVTHEDSIYFIQKNEGYLDFVRIDSDGSRTSYSKEFNGSIGLSGGLLVYLGDINNPDSIISKTFPLPLEINDEYYMGASTYIDGEYTPTMYRLSFANNGEPQLNEFEFNYDHDDDGVADAYLRPSIEQMDIMGDYKCLDIQHGNKTYSRKGESVWDSYPYTKENTFVITEDVDGEELTTELDIVLQDVDGMPVRELSSAKCFYHEELDGLVIVARYPGTSDRIDRHDTSFNAYAFIDGKTNKLTTITQSHAIYYSYDTIALAKTPNGAYALHNGAATMDFNVNTLSVNPIDVSYPSETGIILRFLNNPVTSYAISDGKFFVIDDEDNLLLSVFE